MKTLSAFFALAVAAGAAQAGTVSYSTSMPLTDTNFTNVSLTLPQWDPTMFAGQTLVGVTLSVTGNVSGSAGVENTGASPATITYNVAATVTVTGPGSLIVQALPLASNSFNATAWDGLTNYAGSSGTSETGLNNSDTQSSSLTAPPDDLSAYIGSGSISSILISGTGTSNASGGGNTTSTFSTQAGASDVTVTYTYIPAPPAGVAGVLALSGLAGIRRRRR